MKFFDPNPPSHFSSPLNWPTSKFYNLVLQSEELRRTFTSGLVDVLGVPNRRKDVLTMTNSLEETGRDHRVPQRIYGLLISLTPRPTASVISSALRTVFGLQESTLPLTFAELTCRAGATECHKGSQTLLNFVQGRASFGRQPLRRASKPVHLVGKMARSLEPHVSITRVDSLPRVGGTSEVRAKALAIYGAGADSHVSKPALAFCTSRST